jgi:hypothetical protein
VDGNAFLPSSGLGTSGSDLLGVSSFHLSPFLIRNDDTGRGLVHPKRTPFETQPVRSSAVSSGHLHGFSACLRASALTTLRDSWYSPWLCALVIGLFFFRRPSHMRPLPQAYPGKCPAVMGTSPVLDGNFFPGNSGSADMGTVPDSDGNFFPSNS